MMTQPQTVHPLPDKTQSHPAARIATVFCAILLLAVLVCTAFVHTTVETVFSPAIDTAIHSVSIYETIETALGYSFEEKLNEMIPAELRPFINVDLSGIRGIIDSEPVYAFFTEKAHDYISAIRSNTDAAVTSDEVNALILSIMEEQFPALFPEILTPILLEGMSYLLREVDYSSISLNALREKAGDALNAAHILLSPITKTSLIAASAVLILLILLINGRAIGFSLCTLGTTSALCMPILQLPKLLYPTLQSTLNADALTWLTIADPITDALFLSLSDVGRTALIAGLILLVLGITASVITRCRKTARQDHR